MPSNRNLFYSIKKIISPYLKIFAKILLRLSCWKRKDWSVSRKYNALNRILVVFCISYHSNGHFFAQLCQIIKVFIG